MDVVNLAEALRLLRAELATAQDSGSGQRLRFEITEAEIELLMTLSTEGSTASFGVVSGTGKGSISETTTHRLKLKLDIKDAANRGRHVQVNDDRERSWDN